MRLSIWCASLFFTSIALGASEPIDVLIVSGANNHDWRWTSPSLERMLEKTGKFRVDITYEPNKTLADKATFAKYRAIVLDYNGPSWGEPAQSNFLEAMRGGLGLAVIHAANNSFCGNSEGSPAWPEYQKLVGDCWGKGTGHGTFHAFDLKIVDASHPITKGLGPIRAHPDELYHDLVRTPGTDHKVLASAFSSKESGGTGEDEPMILVANYGRGRVFHTPLGHVWPGSEAQRASHDDPQFQRIVARGVEWAATGDVTETTINAATNASATIDAAGAATTTGDTETSSSPATDGDSRAWITLFDGSDTSAWRGYRQKSFPATGWSVVDGALVSAKGGGGGDLITVQQFGDFEFEFEWRVTDKANSGVMYRVVELDGPSWFSGPEYQVLDNAYFGEKIDFAHSAGALYDICAADPAAPTRPAGEWNSGRIVVQGWKVAHFLNGAPVAACDFGADDGKARVRKSKFAPLTTPMQFMTNSRGHIALQDHGDEVAFRAMRVRPLASNPIELFNRVDGSGWTWIGQTESKFEDVWSFDDAGVLICKGTPVGYIRTVADYTNYVLELDWRWNPAAGENRNSGVLLRMIEEDGVWPKSLEAQLQDGNAGDFWRIKEFPCTPDPARTNGRNTKKTHANEKPLGEWNHYKITVDHKTVTLEVNGQVLNVAHEVLEVPGKICLQSEGAEIHFKNVRLTALP